MGASGSTKCSADNTAVHQPGPTQTPAFGDTARAVNVAEAQAAQGKLLCSFACKCRRPPFLDADGRIPLMLELYEHRFLIKGRGELLASGEIDPKQVKFYLRKPAEYLKEEEQCLYVHDEKEYMYAKVLRRYPNDGLPTYDIKRFTGKYIYKKALFGRKKLWEETKNVPVTDIEVIQDFRNEELDHQTIWCVYGDDCYALEVGTDGQSRETVVNMLKRHGGMILHSKGGTAVSQPRVTHAASPVAPTSAPSQTPSVAPCNGPSVAPTELPSVAPSQAPTPSSAPTKGPTFGTVLQHLQSLMQPPPKE